MNSDQIAGAGEYQPSSETLWRKLVDEEMADSPATGHCDPPGTVDVAAVPAVRVPESIVYRSLTRPPMALLTALDDGSLDRGDTWRLRKSRTRIGRVAGEIVIPHDPDISATHAEVVRREQNGGHQWHIVDLGSTNGTFVRVQQIVLRNGRELLLGGQRLTFSSPDVVVQAGVAETRPQAPRGTHHHAVASPAELRRLGPRLIGQSIVGRVAEFPLMAEGTLIGRDSNKCQIAFVDDPSVDAVHARVYQDVRGRWIFKDAGSLNGVWLRVSQMPLDHDAQFLLGGQRFQFQVP